MYWCFTYLCCLYLCVLVFYLFVLSVFAVPTKARRWHGIPLSGSYKNLRSAMMVRATERGTSRKAVSALKHWAISQAPAFNFSETGSHYVSLTGLVLAMYVRLALNSLIPACLCLPSALIKGVCHQVSKISHFKMQKVKHNTVIVLFMNKQRLFY